MEDMKVSLVDIPDIAFHSGTVLSKDKGNALKDPVDK